MKRPIGVLVLFLIVAAAGAGMTFGAYSKYSDQHSGTSGKAKVTGCTGHTGKYSHLTCNGTWIVGGSLLAGGRVAYGRIDGAARNDVGKTLDVRLHGTDHATVPSIATPIVLLCLGLPTLLLGLFGLFRWWLPAERPVSVTE